MGDAFHDLPRYDSYLWGEQVADRSRSSGEGRGSVLTILLKYREPASRMLVEFPNGGVFFGGEAPADRKPDFELFRRTDDAHKLRLVKLNSTSAMAKGQVRAKGPVPKMLRLLPLTKKLQGSSARPTPRTGSRVLEG